MRPSAEAEVVASSRISSGDSPAGGLEQLEQEPVAELARLVEVLRSTP
jgi:hypothetical protein